MIGTSDVNLNNNVSNKEIEQFEANCNIPGKPATGDKKMTHLNGLNV